MKIGDTYVIPTWNSPGELLEGEEDHAGHTVTVVDVIPDYTSMGPDPHPPGGPDKVSVRCECGHEWSFEDRGPQ